MIDRFGKEIDLDSAFYTTFKEPALVIIPQLNGTIYKQYAISQELYTIEEVLSKMTNVDCTCDTDLVLRFVRRECAVWGAWRVVIRDWRDLIPWIRPVRVHDPDIWKDPRIV